MFELLFLIQTVAKELNKENRTKIKKGAKPLTWRLPGGPTGPAQLPNLAGPARHRYPPCRLLPSPEGRGHAPGARGHAPRPPPPCLAASSSPGPSRDATQPSRPPLTLPRPRPLLCPAPLTTEWSRRHRHRSSWPLTSPRPAILTTSSASLPCTSTPNYMTPYALKPHH